MKARASYGWSLGLFALALGAYLLLRGGTVAQAQPSAPDLEERVAKLEQMAKATFLALQVYEDVLVEQKVIKQREAFQARIKERLAQEMPEMSKDRLDKVKLAQCGINLRNLHLACMQYADTENVFPGHGAPEPGVEGFRQLIRAGVLTQLKTLICPLANDSLKSIEHLLRNGSVIPGKEAEVAELIRLDDEGGTCSYFMTGRTIPQSASGGLPLIVDAHHGVADFPQFFGSKPGGHAHGFQMLTNDGELKFIKLEPGGYDQVTEIKRQMTQEK